jgi:hypothetical protein
MQPINKPKDHVTRVFLVILASLFGIAVIAVIAVFMFTPLLRTGVQPTQSVAPKEERKEPDKPLEYKLAVINAGGFVSENDITVKRFRFLLNDLQKKTGYTRQQIADLNTYAVDTLRDTYGRKVSLLDFMEQSVRPLSAAKVQYKEIIAAMIVLMGRGTN